MGVLVGNFECMNLLLPPFPYKVHESRSVGVARGKRFADTLSKGWSEGFKMKLKSVKSLDTEKKIELKVVGKANLGSKYLC